MTTEERQEFWKSVESGDNPLLSAMSSLVERWGLPAIIMALGDIGKVLSEDAEPEVHTHWTCVHDARKPRLPQVLFLGGGWSPQQCC